MSKKLIYQISVVLVLGLAQTRAADAQEPGLVGWWRLDGNANDSSGNNNHGTLAGNPQWVAGQVGGALDLGGADDYVVCGNGPSLNITGPITIAAWVYPTGSGTSTLPRIVDKSDGASGNLPGYKLYLRPANKYVVTLSAGGVYFNSSSSVTLNTWNYVAFVITGTQWKLFINGTWEQWDRTTLPSVSSESLVIGSSAAGDRSLQGGIDDLRVYSRALTAEEVLKAMKSKPGMASAPSPADTSTDVPTDVALGWTRGQFASTHDVYLGMVFAEVNDADRNSPLLASRSQADTTYDPPGRLDFGTTYYWRIDEVNAPPDSTIFQGDVWSFTTEPIGYPLASGHIVATASSANTDEEKPGNATNGSGLDANNQHSTTVRDMWRTSMTDANPWIQFSFDRPYLLHQMLVWNHNSELESAVGFGIKQAKVEYSLDGIAWTALGTMELARATSRPDYAANTTVAFEGATAQYVRVLPVSNWGGILSQYGLSEVRFLCVPVRAREPQPAAGTMEVAVDATLSWRAGREAAQHQVYLSTDQQAVIDGTAAVTTVSAARYEAAVDLDTTYYWKVNEVNEAEAPSFWPGDVWSFSTEKYMVVDDFESYIDNLDAGGAIFRTWLDGYEVATNGSLVGYGQSPFAERKIVNSGRQSMPLAYDHTGSATYSEATRTFDSPQDWSQHGIKALTLRFYGDPANVAQQMYVEINNTKVPYDGAAEDVQQDQWQMWYIDLTALDVSRVTKLSIGFDRIGAVGGQGMVFIDDIRLYSYDRASITVAAPSAAGLQGQH